MKSLLATVLPAALLIVPLAGCFGSGLGGGDDPPTAEFDFVYTGNGTVYAFDASNSTGSLVSYEWNFGEGTMTEGRLVEMEYTLANATFMVSLVVTDEDGRKAATVKPVPVGSGTNVPPEVHLRDAPRWVPTDGRVVLDATETDDHDGDPIVTLWTFGTYNATPANDTLFDTGNLTQGQTSQQEFTTEGVYFYHCHPHPWMKGRILVDDDAPAGNNSTLTIRNFAFNNDEDLLIPPGTTVTIVNEDPIEHTATIEHFAPGTIAANDPVLDTGEGLPAGDYQAWFVASDLKGGIVAQSWGIKASDDAPVVDWEDASHGAQTQLDNPASFDIGAFEFKANVSADVSYTAVPGAGAMVSFRILDSSGSPVAPAAPCSGSTCSIVADLAAGDYEFEVDLTAGGASQYTVTADFILYTFPPFGDSDAGGAHQH